MSENKIRSLKIKDDLYFNAMAITFDEKKEKAIMVPDAQNQFLIFDRSGSMTGYLNKIMDSAIAYCNKLPEGSTVSLGYFSDTGQYNLTVPYTVTYADNGKKIQYYATSTCGTTTSNQVVLTVNPIPSVPTTTGATICIGSTATLTASGAGSGDQYKWYDAATAGNILQTSSSTTYVTPVIGVTTNYWVSIINAGGCESSRTQVTATFPTVSTDTQTPGNDFWNGYVYDGTSFNAYYGHYTETETFNQSFGGNTTCFGITSNSNPISIYTETYSVKYLMKSTKRGLWVVDLGSDDGSRLTVDGTLLYDNWEDQAFSTRPRILMNLTGASSLIYDFYENGGENQVVFQNLTQILANNLTTNTTQTIAVGSSGTAISGDVFGTLPTGISLIGSGYQWTYSTTSGGARINIPGATGATYTPDATVAPFNIEGTYYIYRNAVVRSTNNVPISQYDATNESNVATILIAKNYWTGSVSNDWFTPANWSTSSVPTGTYDITIPSSLSRYPVLSGNSPANDVTIKNAVSLILEDGATMTLEAGPVLTIESGATVTIGTGSKIILKSDAIYINLSNNTPTLEMERTLTGVKGWRMVASPLNTKINDMLTSPLITQGFTGSTYPSLQPNLMWWDETDPGTTLQSWRKPANVNDDVTGGRGLFHYIFNGAGITGGGTYADALPQTMSVTGVENFNGIGSYNYNLSYTARTPLTSGTNYDDINALDQGWNLIGNPTASTLDWDATTAWTKTNVDNTIYVWDPSALSGNGDYLYWNGSAGTLPNGKIPPFQAFWVHANTTSPVLSFTNAAKTSTTGTFMRSPAVNESLNVPITLTSNGMETTSFISFTSNGIKGPDNKDAYRLEPMNDAWIELYTLSSPDHVSPLTINNLPVNDTDLVNIPLFVGVQLADSTINDSFTVKWTLPDNWPSDWNISLQHHQVSTAVSMTDNVEYAFNYAANQAVNSSTSGGMYAPKQLVKHGAKKDPTVKKLPDFSIIISKNGKEIGYMEPVPRFMLNYPNPFSNNTTLRFSLPKSEQVRMEAYNLNGLRIETLTNRVFPAGISEIQWYPNSKIPGVYFIRFISGDTVETRKVIYEH